ncbi:hypothetical protein GH714_019859 [Hevea brasiliensis]|uniref:Protein kinase domain-containing protein n=1 Tax=Hevea brasiliensis TaxID=3981 RepID=A0A6A6LN70_HEVBR|nr:hypothetical protein GH714_019859 [Hevea brasiliensis]
MPKPTIYVCYWSQKNRDFTYFEILNITNNFERVLGKGGFGTVCRGYLDGTEVAVKMLSPLSVQGTSEMSTNVLSWERRLQIAVDAAKGLEYLHNGCKPAIVHRDVKTANILLNDKFQAKLADFGLSRPFLVEGGTHISTDVVVLIFGIRALRSRPKMSHIELERAKRERELKEKEEASKIESSITAAGTLFPEKESSVSLKYPMLTKSNYAAWAIKMEVFMMAQGVWDAIESPDPIDSRRDKMALVAIYQGIGEDTLLQLGAKKTAKEAWNMLKMMNQGADKVKEVRSQTLWREFEALRMGDSENVDDFSGKLTIIVNKLRNLGNTVEEERVVKKLLRSVSSKFLQIVSAIEEFSDLTTKSVEEVIGSLKAHEERLLSCGGKSDETLLLTRAEWKAREEATKNKKASANSRGGRSGGRGGRGRGRGRHCGESSRGGDDESKPQKKKFDKSKEKDEQANLTETEEVEPALLLIENCELNVSKEEIYIEEPSLLMIETCEVTEGEVYAAATGGSLMKEVGWYLDTRASNHMADFWGEAVKTSVYVLNRCLTKSVEGMTPYQAWCKKIPNIHHLRVFGCLSHIKVTSPHLTKLEDRSVKGVMIGYEEGSKAYRLYDPVKKKLIISRDVIFEEEKSWPWQSEKKEEELENVNIFTVKLRDAGGATTVSEEGEVSPKSTAQISPTSTSESESDSNSTNSTPPRKFRSLQEIYNETREVEAEIGKCPFEHAVYMKETENDVTVVGVYVDDLILTGSSATLIDKFKHEMKKVFEMSDLGLLSYYLGIEVKQNSESITLCQSSYASKILEKAGMSDCNSCRIPMDPRCKLSKHDEEPPVDATTYRSIIGSLRYLVNTRPDLAYSVGVVSRYMESPTTSHMNAVKQILRYVKGTLDLGIVYKKNQECKPVLARTNPVTHLSQWVSSLLATGHIENVVDPRLDGDFNINSVGKAVEIAMACTSPTCTRRPTKLRVVNELNECLAAEIAPTKERHEFELNGSTRVLNESIPLAR